MTHEEFAHKDASACPSEGAAATQRRSILAGLGGLAAGALLAGRAHAGPLNPPAGPVTSTGKTLTEVEPRIAINAVNTPGDADSLFRISQPGSYYLAGNVAGVSGKHGIKITASGVTIDLNGFDLSGVTGSLSGIFAFGSINSICIQNGKVRNWRGSGISASSSTGVLLRDLIAMSNAATGILCGGSSVISDCVARDNVIGIVCGERSVVTHCTAGLNSNAGIQTSTAAVVSGCSADENGGQGIVLGFLGYVAGCTASRNALTGISTNSSCTIIDNTASENTSHGIDVAFHCIVRGNTSTLNATGAGIRVRNNHCRIERNQLSSNSTGLLVSGSRNLIIGNSVSQSTSVNYNIAGGNRYGPIIDATATGSAAVNGSAAAGTLLTTDPNANLSL